MARFELTDTQFNRLLPLLPPEHSGKAGHPFADHRRVLNGIAWIMRTGATWRDLPVRYGPWQTCYNRLTHWEADGTWAKIIETARQDRRLLRAVADVFVEAPNIKVHRNPAAIGARSSSAVRKTSRAADTRCTTLTLWSEGDAN